MQDHQVHERAWVSILSGEAEITTTAGERIAGTPGLLVEFDDRQSPVLPWTPTKRIELATAALLHTVELRQEALEPQQSRKETAASAAT